MFKKTQNLNIKYFSEDGFEFFFNEIKHPKTTNFGVAKIQMLISQYFTDPNGQVKCYIKSCTGPQLSVVHSFIKLETNY